MSNELEYRALGGEEELGAHAALLDRCFRAGAGGTPALEWVRAAGTENVRGLWRGARLVGTLSALPMGQWFGGRPVSTAGVAGVGVEPDQRGQGVARELMRRALLGFHESGFALSTLYASTYTLYRSVGYERAGSRFEVRLRATDLRPSAQELGARPIEPDDEPRVEALYRAWARGQAGVLDRGPYVWRRQREPREQLAQGVLVGDGEQLEGYVRWFQPAPRIGRGTYDVVATDLVALTPRALRRVLSVLAEMRSIASEVAWFAGPADPFAAQLAERDWSLALRDQWLVRVVDVAAALEARGYPAGVEAELHLAVEDELLPWNQGSFVLSVHGGSGSVRTGGDGRIRVTARGLAPLFTGHQSPVQLAALGWIEADADELARAAAVFAGPAPWMPDTF